MLQINLLSGHILPMPTKQTEALAETVANGIGNASEEKAGLLSPEDKAKLNQMEAGDKNMQSVTWAALVALRDESNLVPGMFYRITDYITTVANDPGARSENHLFDVVVLALDVNKLSEEACAVHSVRDADGYFSNAKVEAWKIWYCLDNDTTRFAWADTDNGKGVIYRMIDEWRNDLPYDFKNVQFKRYLTYGDFISDVVDDGEWINTHYILGEGMEINGLSIEDTDYEWMYTFSKIAIDDQVTIGNVQDASLLNIHTVNGNPFYAERGCVCNSMKPYMTSIIVDDTTYMVRALNNIVITKYDDEDIYDLNLKNNEWEADCYNMTFHEHYYGNKFGSSCHDIIGFKFYNNTLGNSVYKNKFGSGFCGNQIGSYFRWNTIGSNVYDNQIGSDFYRNTIGSDFCGNQIGSYVYSNQIGSNVHDNQIGSYFCWNTIGSDFCGNQIGSNCWYNILSNNVQYSVLLNNIVNISLPQNIRYVEVLSGTKGDNNNKLAIPFVTNVNYSQFAGQNSAGELKIWTPADLV